MVFVKKLLVRISAFQYRYRHFMLACVQIIKRCPPIKLSAQVSCPVGFLFVLRFILQIRRSLTVALSIGHMTWPASAF